MAKKKTGKKEVEVKETIKTEKKKSNTIWSIIGVTVVILLLLGAVYVIVDRSTYAYPINGDDPIGNVIEDDETLPYLREVGMDDLSLKDPYISEIDGKIYYTATAYNNYEKSIYIETLSIVININGKAEDRLLLEDYTLPGKTGVTVRALIEGNYKDIENMHYALKQERLEK